jgi:hypothetical protein
MANFKPELTEAFDKNAKTAFESYVACVNAVERNHIEGDPRIVFLCGLTTCLKAKIKEGGDIDRTIAQAFAPLVHFLQKRYEEENKKDAVSEAEDIIKE